MIISFRSRTTQDIYHGIASQKARKIPPVLWRVAQRKMDMLNASITLGDLKIPPGNRLESLKGNLRGKYSIRINDQYRLVFGFKDVNAYDVEIADYHK